MDSTQIDFYRNMFSDFIASYTALFGVLITTTCCIFVLKYWFDAKKIKKIASAEAKKAAKIASKKAARIAAKKSAEEAANSAVKNTEEKIIQMLYNQIDFYREIIKMQSDDKMVIILSSKLICSIVTMILFTPSPQSFMSFLDKIYDLLHNMLAYQFNANYTQLNLKINELIKSYDECSWTSYGLAIESQLPFNNVIDSIKGDLQKLMLSHSDDGLLLS